MTNILIKELITNQIQFDFFSCPTTCISKLYDFFFFKKCIRLFCFLFHLLKSKFIYSNLWCIRDIYSHIIFSYIAYNSNIMRYIYIYFTRFILIFRGVCAEGFHSVGLKRKIANKTNNIIIHDHRWWFIKRYLIMYSSNEERNE